MNECLQSDSTYKLRGHRVPSVTEKEIYLLAEQLCKALQITQQNLGPEGIGLFMQKLEVYGINVNPIEDCEWLDIAEAMLDPDALMIHMPSKLYTALHSKNNYHAVRIFLHELGHIFLAHKPHLHFSDKKPQESEDSEWQADTFSDAILRHLRYFDVLPMQLELELKVF